MGTGRVEGRLRGDCDPSKLDNVEDDIADGGQAKMFPPSGLERSSVFKVREATHGASWSPKNVAVGRDSVVAAAADLRSLRREAKFSLDATDSDYAHATRDSGNCRVKSHVKIIFSIRMTRFLATKRTSFLTRHASSSLC